MYFNKMNSGYKHKNWFNGTVFHFFKEIVPLTASFLFVNVLKIKKVIPILESPDCLIIVL